MPHDAGKALEVVMTAVEAAAMAGDAAQLATAARLGAGLEPGSGSGSEERAFIATFLSGLRLFLDGDRARSGPLLTSCLDMASRFDDPRRMLWGASAAFYVGDRDRRQDFLDRTVARARATGAVGLLPYPLAWRSGSEFQLGRTAEAAADADEAATLARDIGLAGAAAYPTAILARVAALHGRDEECRTLAEEALELSDVHGLAVASAHARLALAELELASRRWGEALDHLEALADPRPGRGHPVFAMGTTTELVEAAVHLGRLDRAHEAFTKYEAWVENSQIGWERPGLARCRALLSSPADAAQHFDEALRLHAKVPMELDRARTHLLYGEHLRRQGMTAHASDHLRIALGTFERLDAATWAVRARAELRASGETARARDSSAISRLTPHELQLARLVAEGHSNREAAARLFLSPRTIDARLHAVLAKLGVSSRMELADFGLVPGIDRGVLRSRLARAGLAELLRDLRALRGGALQAALGRTIGDPELVVARPAATSGEYTDADGKPVDLPAGAGSRASAAIERDGRTVATLVYDASLDEDPELVEALCAAATIALENEHLQSEAQARLAELQASRQRIVAAGDAARRRLERDLHDGAQQRLVALAMQLSLIRVDIRRDPATAEALRHKRQRRARGVAGGAAGSGPRDASGSADERPSVSARVARGARSSVPTEVSCDIPDGISEQVELAAYFVACESLANVAKYASATTASVRVSRTDDGIAIEIADDGVGGADESGAGSGLRGLADRVEALGGSLLVTSPAGAGTVVTASLPCAPVVTHVGSSNT